ncbi:putative protein FAM172B [Erpetoichthys calabaricus]|nr:putative protein FAM172B [Erpetoichthys calabaricus]
MEDLEKYSFTEEGELRQKETCEAFVFNYYKDDYESNHLRYQALGHLITQHVYRVLEEKCNLQRVYIPVEAREQEPKSLFFMSPGALDNPKGLIILIQDRGAIRAGQWNIKVIASEGMEKGSQIPYIKKALGESSGVIVMNPNDNFLESFGECDTTTEYIRMSEKEELINKCMKDKRFIPLAKRGSTTPEEHVQYIWDHFIANSSANQIAVVAHGYGGLVFMDLLSQRSEQVQKKVYAVALIDSVHNMWHQVKDKELQKWIQKHCRKWVLSSKPIDRYTTFMKVDCPQVSAGTESREYAPWSCIQSVFRFFGRILKGKTTHFSRDVIITRSKSEKKTTPPSKEQWTNRRLNRKTSGVGRSRTSC